MTDDGPREHTPARYALFLLLLVLPVASLGALSFVAPLLRVADQRDDRRLRARANALAAAAPVAWVTGFVLVGTSDRGSAGSDVGAALLMATIVGGVFLAVAWFLPSRRPVTARRARPLPPAPPAPPAAATGAAEPLPVRLARERRALREQYRALVQSDPALALELRVGRPDLPEPLDDGDLVDLNRVDPAHLVAEHGLSAEEAEQVVRARERQHGLRSFDELVVHTGLGATSLERLREYAVFVPR